ncbi:GH22561 [Drosophila grimshawi]|uniref:GH22561 n=1 Tax=Drosophila grimshawi TaxID=7222 RepID=B4K220_DROGR|nr:GH22561 [Drosophila grimshawi]
MELNAALLTVCQLLLVVVPPAQLQPYYPHAHPHRQQLYYDAPPRLRRLEYAPAPVAAPFVSGYVAPPAAHYQQHTPNFQLINYRPSYQPLALEYQQQQPPAPPAAPLSSIYPQPSAQYLQRSLAPHAELAKYRYEGNYMPLQHRVAIAPQQPAPSLQQLQQLQQQRRIEDQLYNVPPALFTSDVLHVVPSRTAAIQQQQSQQQQHQQQQQQQAERSRRFAIRQNGNVDAVAAESRMDSEKPKKETKYFHDIFMRFDGAHGRKHGHVLEHPKAQERRFETQRGTNRYKGEVIWTDRQGGHGEHRWDLAQGKL